MTKKKDKIITDTLDKAAAEINKSRDELVAEAEKAIVEEAAKTVEESNAEGKTKESRFFTRLIGKLFGLFKKTK